jgi:hypothetical protein
VLVNVQVVVSPATTVIAAGAPFVQLELVSVQPDGSGTVSVTLKLPPAVRSLNVLLAVPSLVVRDVSPKLLVNAKVPSPPTVFFTTLIDPGVGATEQILISL